MLMAIAAAALAAAAPATPQAPDPAATAEPAPAVDPLARQLIDAIGSGDEARARSFFAESFAPHADGSEPAERTLARLLALTRQSGGIQVSEWHPQGERIFFDGRTARQGIAVQGMIGVRGGRIVALEVQRDPLARGGDAPAWPPAAATPAEAVRAIASEIDWRSRTERFSGAVLVAYRGKPVLERAWGLAVRGPDAPATTGTLFTTASASKMLTSVAIARLIDQGRLGFDTSVAAAVPALANAPGADGVTIADLLGHRASYGDYFSETEQDPRIASHVTATELLPLIAGREPQRAPEGRVAYSNANYLVLAAAVEAASGRSYYDFVAAEVLEPLGMTRTVFGSAAARPGGAAVGWVKDEVGDPLGLGAWLPNDHRMGGFRGGPAGGAWSTAGDMWRLVDGVAAGKLVRPETRDRMWGDRRRVGRNLASALGFMARGGDKPAFFGHSGGGGNAGVSTSAFVSPDREWAVVVLSNFSSPAGEMLGGQIMDYLAALPRPEAQSGAAKEKLERVKGIEPSS